MTAPEPARIAAGLTPAMRAWFVTDPDAGVEKFFTPLGIAVRAALAGPCTPHDGDDA